MPELPEVETVKETLKRQILGKTITNVRLFYDGVIAAPASHLFIEKIIGQTIVDMKRRGKWIVFELNDYYLLSHLRMEGKYFIKDPGEEVGKHEHIALVLGGLELRYQDVRKFGKMHLLDKETAFLEKPMNELGLEPWDESLTVTYLKEVFQNKNIPIKTVLLDQSIIVGIGNIYANEILYLCKLHPETKTKEVSEEMVEQIIFHTREVLEKAIKAGGTTIRSYTSSLGVTGLFQFDLYVHGKEGSTCSSCTDVIQKIKLGGRGTYYCPTCQQIKEKQAV